jgi:cation diffusion facilitator CzcD-associated flavoprotein CzcO
LSSRSSNQEPTEKYDAVVVGGGPAGVAAVGTLLHYKVGKVLWVDDKFKAGRLNEKYREVPR